MRGPQKLLDTEDNWRTRMGAWFPGERVVYRGKDLFEDLKDQRWMGLLLYGITGRIFNDKQVRLFEGLYCLCSSFPDPRLWNNRVAALAGTVRSTKTLAITAAIAVSEATIFGHRADIGAIDFLLRSKRQVDIGISLEVVVERELKKYRRIPGYGRPIVAIDERISSVMKLAEQLGFDDGIYVKLAFQIDSILQEGRWRMRLNIAGLSAALAADQDLDAKEYNCLVIPSFTAGIIPCLIDSIEQPEGSFLPLACDRIAYTGLTRRAWDHM